MFNFGLLVLDFGLETVFVAAFGFILCFAVLVFGFQAFLDVGFGVVVVNLGR